MDLHHLISGLSCRDQIAGTSFCDLDSSMPDVLKGEKSSLLAIQKKATKIRVQLDKCKAVVERQKSSSDPDSKKSWDTAARMLDKSEESLAAVEAQVEVLKEGIKSVFLRYGQDCQKKEGNVLLINTSMPGLFCAGANGISTELRNAAKNIKVVEWVKEHLLKKVPQLQA